MRGFAAELECDFFEVGFSGGFHDLAPGDCAAREGDFVDMHVFGEGGAANGSVGWDAVQDAGREAEKAATSEHAVKEEGRIDEQPRTAGGGTRDDNLPCFDDQFAHFLYRMLS